MARRPEELVTGCVRRRHQIVTIFREALATLAEREISLVAQKLLMRLRKKCQREHSPGLKRGNLEESNAILSLHLFLDSKASAKVKDVVFPADSHGTTRAVDVALNDPIIAKRDGSRQGSHENDRAGRDLTKELPHSLTGAILEFIAESRKLPFGREYVGKSRGGCRITRLHREYQ